MFTRAASLLLFLAVLTVPAAYAQAVWVEFAPGTCQVGPPPNCVAGHWHLVFVPTRTSGTSTMQQAGAAAGLAPLPAHTTAVGGAPAGNDPEAGGEPARGARTPGQAAEDQTEEEEESSFFKISEISAQLEYEDFTAGSGDAALEGRAVGVRAAYVRTGTTGLSYGGYGSFEKSSFSEGDTRAPTILTASLFASRPINEWLPPSVAAQAFVAQSLVMLSGGLSFSSYNGGEEVNALTTFSPFLSMNMIWFGRPNLNVGGGLTYAYSRTQFDGFEDGGQGQGALSLAFNGGYRMSENYYVAGELFRIRGGLVVLGASATRFFTERFGLTLGAKKLFGFTDYSNFKLTLGSSARF